jgi:conjugative transposon TraM protein
MSTPKHTQEFLKKRQLMLFAPLPIVLCLTALFAVGGGGKGVAAATAASNAPGASGLNLSLPSAGKTTLFENKMQAAAAPQDSNRHNNLAFAPPITTAAGAAPGTPGAPATGNQPAGVNYAVQPGQPGQKYDPNADPNVVAMQTRMQRLQEQTSTQPGTAPATAPVASSVRTSSAAVAAAPAHDTRMDASLKELDELKNQYQQRLLAMNSPVTSAAAPVATSVASAKKMTVITQVRPSVVSSLRTQTAPQANGFHTLGESGATPNVNSVPAVIHSDQVVEAGSTVKLRLLQDVQLEGHLIPRNSFLYGTCSLAGNRLTIAATSVQYQGNLLPVSLKAFDIDGNEGLNIPGSIDRDALKQGAAQGVSSADMLTMSPSLGAQAAGIAIQTGKALTGRKIKTVKIHLKANYQLLLKS